MWVTRRHIFFVGGKFWIEIKFAHFSWWQFFLSTKKTFSYRKIIETRSQGLMAHLRYLRFARTRGREYQLDPMVFIHASSKWVETPELLSVMWLLSEDFPMTFQGHCENYKNKKIEWDLTTRLWHCQVPPLFVLKVVPDGWLDLDFNLDLESNKSRSVLDFAYGIWSF